MNIGFIGLGNMGFPIMSHIKNNSHKLFVYDNDKKKLNNIKDNDISICTNVNDVANNSEVLFTCLPSIDIVEVVLIEISENKRVPQMCIDLSSSDPSKTIKLAKTLNKKNIRFIDAPISGGVKGAINASLTIMVGGSKTDFEFAKSLLELFGKKLSHIGGVGTGQAAKCLNNLCSATGLLIAIECVNVAKAFGIDQNNFIDILNTSTGKNNSTENKLKQFVISKKFNSGFNLSLMKKDIISAWKLAINKNVPLPLGTKSKEFWSQADDVLPPKSDHTEIIKWLEQIKN